MRSGSDEWRSFLTLAREQHFHKASEQLFISQPALSKQIRRLEEKIGAPLFVRNRHKVALTEVGKVLMPLAEKLIKDSTEVFALAREMAEGRRGMLRIGFGTSAVSKVLPKAVHRFRNLYKNVGVTMNYMQTQLQVDALLTDRLDIGLVRLPIVEPELDTLALFRERLILATPRFIPYMTKRGLKSLSDRPFILLTRVGSTSFKVTERFEEALVNARHRDVIMAVCQHSGFEPKVIHEASDLFTLVNLVSAGIGISLVPSAATRIAIPAVKFHELNMNEAEWSIGIAWKRCSEKSNLVSRFLAIISKISSQQHPRRLQDKITL